MLTQEDIDERMELVIAGMSEALGTDVYWDAGGAGDPVRVYRDDAGWEVDIVTAGLDTVLLGRAEAWLAGFRCAQLEAAR